MSMKYKKVLSPPPVEAATRDEALNFVRGLQPLRPKDDEPIDEAAVKEYVNKFSLGSLQGIARRIMMDVMKGRIDDEAEDAASEPAPTNGKTSASKRTTPQGRKRSPAPKGSAGAAAAQDRTRAGRGKATRKR
jgi:hypothetical protein